MESISSVAVNLAEVKSRMAAAAGRAGRDPSQVGLVAISKTHPADHVRPALEAGHRVFGENRVQEAEGKWPGLRESFPELVLHLVGPLQTNKVRKALALFDAIQTVDRPRLARALAEEMDRSGRRPACYIEINTGAEPQKAGVVPEDADAFIRASLDEYGLPVAGLMCIPPFHEDPSPHFALLREIARRNGLAGLSMGMSDDYITAIGHGATLVRVGTAIFGTRPAPRAE